MMLFEELTEEHDFGLVFFLGPVDEQMIVDGNALFIAKATVTEFLTRFLDYYQTEGGVALRTWQDYHYHIETNIVPAIGALPLGELKPLQVDEWIRGLRERGLGDRTIEYADSVRRRALQFAVEWEILDRNPAGARFRAAKRKLKPGGQRVRFLDPDETRRFRESHQGRRA